MPDKRKREQAVEEKELLLPSNGQVVCVIDEIIGADFVKVRCSDGASRSCRIPGRFRRRTWLSEGDVVLVQPWDFQPNKGDILHKYSKDEIRRLVNMGVVPREFIEGGT
ncbi:MAG: translation initiation factor aIF-1A [Ignisphaera sp.]|nr:translation initiation factor aIF-1A [Ignisphaera sp.]MCX8168343.1 translation initiation factor aIF-1A [Ignisphaera sp.]MDW8085324.1 translation initiation factor aIF-1A [Ignisphaera sp.]